MKKFFLFAATAAMLTSCSTEELSTRNATVQDSAENAVAFSIYTPRSVTRAGLPLEQTTSTVGMADGQDGKLHGFGVFGYYTDGQDYYSANTFPNFMYNQRVKGNGTGSNPTEWTYEPVKYWPNEYGNAAISDDIDRVSFFSYAPWINVTPSTGIPVVEDPDYDALASGLGLKYVETTMAPVTDAETFIKYLHQQGYAGPTDSASIVAYVNNNYNTSFNKGSSPYWKDAFDNAIDEVKDHQNLQYISDIQEKQVTDKATYAAYLKTQSTLTDDAALAEAETKLTEINKQQFQSKNITALTRNTATGDPVVKYVVDPNPRNSVDLLWGVAAQAYSTTWAGKKVTDIAANEPFIDLVKPSEPTGTGAVDSKVKFNLRHALSKLIVTIDYFDDTTAPAGTGKLGSDKQTKIFVREVHIGGFAMQGALNLNSDDNGFYAADSPIPNWKAYGCNACDGFDEIENEFEEVWFKDGRRDGKEGMVGAEAINEKYLGLNPAIIQSAPYVLDVKNDSVIFNETWSNVYTGVTNVPQNLFNGAFATDPIYVIPLNQDIDVRIIYDVETVNPKLPGLLSDGVTHGSTIKNDIRKSVKDIIVTSGTFGKMQAGNAYTIHLHLGMTSVKVEAVVQDWDNNTGHAILPENNN